MTDRPAISELARVLVQQHALVQTVRCLVEVMREQAIVSDARLVELAEAIIANSRKNMSDPRLSDELAEHVNYMLAAGGNEPPNLRVIVGGKVD